MAIKVINLHISPSLTRPKPIIAKNNLILRILRMLKTKEAKKHLMRSRQRNMTKRIKKVNSLTKSPKLMILFKLVP